MTAEAQSLFIPVQSQSSCKHSQHSSLLLVPRLGPLLRLHFGPQGHTPARVTPSLSMEFEHKVHKPLTKRLHDCHPSLSPDPSLTADTAAPATLK